MKQLAQLAEGICDNTEKLEDDPVDIVELDHVDMNPSKVSKSGPVVLDKDHGCSPEKHPV